MNKHQFDEIFRKHYTELCKIAYQKVGDFQIAEDIVQDLFLDFWRRMTDFSNVDQISNYLRRSISLKCIDHIKSILKEESKIIKLDGIDIEDVSTQQNYGDDPQLYKKLKLLIDELPPKRKAVFILSRFDGKTYKEIATDLDISVKSVEKHIGKALFQLRKLLGVILMIFKLILQ